MIKSHWQASSLLCMAALITAGAVSAQTGEISARALAGRPMASQGRTSAATNSAEQTICQMLRSSVRAVSGLRSTDPGLDVSASLRPTIWSGTTNSWGQQGDYKDKDGDDRKYKDRDDRHDKDKDKDKDHTHPAPAPEPSHTTVIRCRISYWRGCFSSGTATQEASVTPFASMKRGFALKKGLCTRIRRSPQTAECGLPFPMFSGLPTTAPAGSSKPAGVHGSGSL